MNAKPFPRIVLVLGLAASSIAMAAVVRADDDPEHYTIEEVQACSGDAMRLCRDELTDVHKIETCMETKKAELSQACQAMFVPGHRH